MSLIKIENASLGYEGKTVVNDISVDIKAIERFDYL